MFLANWFELSGVDEILAPTNEDSPAIQQREYEESPIWSILAPRCDISHPNHHPPTVMGNANASCAKADAVAEERDVVERKKQELSNHVRCRHCHKLTPIDGPRGSAAEASMEHSQLPADESTAASASLSLNTTSNNQQLSEEISDLNRRVLQACRGAAQTSQSKNSEIILKLFERCLPPVGTKQHPKRYDPNNPSKNIKGIKRILKNHPHLITVRSGDMAVNVPDGFNLLHAACRGKGNAEVVDFLLQEYVLKEPEKSTANETVDEDYEEGSGGTTTRLDINDTNVLGRTALHIAAEECNTDILHMLKDAYETLRARENGRSENSEEEVLLTEQLKGISLQSDNNHQDSSSDTINDVTAATTFMSPVRSSKQQHTRQRKTKSPKRTIDFSGQNVPLDLDGKSPLAHAVNSRVKHNNHRKAATKILYDKGGDPCLDGVEKTPPMERCGGRRGMFSPRKDDCRSPVPVTNYLSPTPKRYSSSSRLLAPMTSSSVYETPFSSPPPTTRSDDDNVNNDGGLNWGASEKPGWRIDMEDAMCCHYPLPVPSKIFDDGNTTPTLGVFGVFDGHGDGGFASKYIARNLLDKLTSHTNWALAYHSIDSDTNSTTEGDGPMLSLLEDSFLRLDDDLRNHPSHIKNGGSTAIVAVISDKKMCIANVGDSRCILVKKRSDGEVKRDDMEGNEVKQSSDMTLDELNVVPLSEDHKPDLPSERARIEAAGMTIHVDHIPPEDGDSSELPTTIHKVKKSNNELLAMARAFGDFDFKSNEELSPSRQAVICTPEIIIKERTSEDMYLILACDGIWDVMSNEEVGLFVSNKVSERSCAVEENDGVLARVGDDLLDLCLKKGSKDNMSVLIVSFPASGFGTVMDSSGIVRSEIMAGGKKLTY
eukprot:scaffold19525_cov68-Cyclotella_meneghiniana.AAC.6